MAHGVPSRLALICCNRKSLEARLFCLLRFVRAELLICSDFGMKICLVFSGEAAGVHFECWRRMFKSWALLEVFVKFSPKIRRRVLSLNNSLLQALHVCQW